MNDIYVSGRRHTFKGVYRSWEEAANKGKAYKRVTKKRWYIKKTEIGYILYVQR